MNILRNNENLKTSLYLTKFRLTHNDNGLKLTLKSNLFILLVILAVPLILIFITKDNFVFSTNMQKNINAENENQIINGKFKAPIMGVITSGYGYRIDPISKKSSKHTGIDIAGSIHCEVKSITDGKVTFAGSKSGYGNCIEIMHSINGKEIYSFYAHLAKICVNENDNVSSNTVIGIQGRRS